jgi:hypothetical protein
MRLIRANAAALWGCFLLVCVGAQLGCPASLSAEDAVAARNANSEAAVEQRIDEAVRYLASDELEGRGLGTKGIDVAAQYLAQQFRELGLKTDHYDGTPFQTFNVTISSKLGPTEKNQLTLDAPEASGNRAAPENEEQKTAPQDRELKVGTDFMPLALGGSDEFDLPVVFAGYGITSSEDKYDDYQGIDVNGKAVIVLRHEPQQSNPHGPFDGTRDSSHAPLARKISNAYQHGAEAVILVTDEAEIRERVADAARRYRRALDAIAEANDELKAVKDPTLDQIESHRKKIDSLLERARTASRSVAAEYDPLFPFDRGGDTTDSRRFAVLHCRRGAIDPMIQAALGTNLADLERQIDLDLKPRSRELAGWRIRGQTNIERVETTVKNVIAVLEGEGPKAQETIVVGAHYDHLGRGESGSLAAGSKEIHNGADDNGSGTAALVEVARRLAARDKKLPRRVVFIAFTGEERGLLGSGHYVHHPLVPIEKTVAMLNMDMVGRMKNDELVIYGTGTAKTFDGLIDSLNEGHRFSIKREPGGFGPSDHSSFYARKIPVLHFFTGLHNDYHRPSDDTNKLNLPGIRRVSEMVAEAVVKIAETENPPEYQQAQRESLRPGDQPAGDRPYFGSIPNLAGGEEEGYAIQGVGNDSPAQKAGMQAGDVIIGLGDNKIGNLADFDSALRKYKAGDKVAVVVRRDGKEVKLDVVLEAPR